MNITLPSFVNATVASNVTKRANEVNNITLCIDVRPDIPVDNSTYPLYDFVSTTDFSNFTPMCLNVTFTGTQYCASIAVTNITVFAAALNSNWKSKDSIFDGNTAVQNALYFLSAAMFLLLVLCIVALIYHFVVTATAFSVSKVSLSFLVRKFFEFIFKLKI